MQRFPSHDGNTNNNDNSSSSSDNDNNDNNYIQLIEQIMSGSNKLSLFLLKTQLKQNIISKVAIADYLFNNKAFEQICDALQFPAFMDLLGDLIVFDALSVVNKIQDYPKWIQQNLSTLQNYCKAAHLAFKKDSLGSAIAITVSYCVNEIANVPALITRAFRELTDYLDKMRYGRDCHKRPLLFMAKEEFRILLNKERQYNNQHTNDKKAHAIIEESPVSRIISTRHHLLNYAYYYLATRSNSEINRALCATVARAFYMLGKAYQITNDTEKARHCFTNTLKFDTSAYYYYYKLANNQLKSMDQKNTHKNYLGAVDRAKTTINLNNNSVPRGPSTYCTQPHESTMITFFKGGTTRTTDAKFPNGSYSGWCNTTTLTLATNKRPYCYIENTDSSHHDRDQPTTDTKRRRIRK